MKPKTETAVDHTRQNGFVLVGLGALQVFSAELQPPSRERTERFAQGVAAVFVGSLIILATGKQKRKDGHKHHE